jgi:hypothetical protein
MSVAGEHGQRLVAFPQRKVDEAGAAPEASEETRTGSRWGLRLRPLRGRQALIPSLSGEAREERAQEREQAKQAAAVEAAKEVFFQTPAGRARLAYKRGHQLFQYELAIGELEPTVVPGRIGSPARQTTDPVDILNSVTAEGWKLVTGKFFSSEMHGGVVGCYLFKRSQKRRQPMNNPWQAGS